MLHTEYQGSSSSDFSQKVLSPLLGLVVSDRKRFPCRNALTSMNEDSIERKEKISVVSVSTLSRAGESGACTPLTYDVVVNCTMYIGTHSCKEFL